MTNEPPEYNDLCICSHSQKIHGTAISPPEGPPGPDVCWECFHNGNWSKSYHSFKLDNLEYCKKVYERTHSR